MGKLRMNYKEYIAAVDKKLREMDEDELRGWIYNYARQRSEEDRESFLNSLEISSDRQQDIQDMEKLKNWLRDMRAEKYILLYSEYEDNSSGYWNSDWTIEYEDPYGIGGMIDWAYELGERWVYEKNYENAAFLYSRVNQMLIYAKGGEYSDDIEMNVEDLSSEGFVHTDLKRAAALTMYVLYQTRNTFQERTEAVYPYFQRGIGQKMKIEDMLSIGPEELAGTEAFLEAWISFLREKNGERDLELLENAILCRYGAEGMAKYAEENAQEHPLVVKREIMRRIEASDYEEAKKLGIQAVRKLNCDWEIRGEIAELACRAAKKTGDRKMEGEMLYQACYSRPAAMNYLNCLVSEEVEEEKIKLLDERIEEMKRWNKAPYVFRQSSEKGRFSASETEDLFIAFFQQKYDKIMACCREQKAPLGWSGSQIRIGVPLLLMGLYQGSSPGKGLSVLMDQLAYEIGGNEAEKAAFKEAFMKWKRTHMFPEEQKKAYAEYLEKAIDARVCAIVSGQHRGSYRKAALLAASLDEALDSMGDAKSIVYRYHQKFSKHRAFRAELRELER